LIGQIAVTDLAPGSGATRREQVMDFSQHRDSRRRSRRERRFSAGAVFCAPLKKHG